MVWYTHTIHKDIDVQQAASSYMDINEIHRQEHEKMTLKQKQ